jgi:predicted nucleic acid-binding protein
MATLYVENVPEELYPALRVRARECHRSIAVTFGRSINDSLYVALAVKSDAPLITVDRKLADALAARLPVKWLGAIHF